MKLSGALAERIYLETIVWIAFLAHPRVLWI